MLNYVLRIISAISGPLFIELRLHKTIPGWLQMASAAVGELHLRSKMDLVQRQAGRQARRQAGRQAGRQEGRQAERRLRSLPRRQEVGKSYPYVPVEVLEIQFILLTF